jgi:hypothetical protein
MKPTHKNLYIIGNGFDLYHRIASSYNHFKEFLKEKDYQLYELIRKYLPLTVERKEEWIKFKDSFGSLTRDWLDTKDISEIYKDDWSILEEAFGGFDRDFVLDELSLYLKSYGAEDWSEADNHTFQSEIEKIAQALSHDLRRFFTQWVLQLAIPKPYEMDGRKLNLNKDGLYLNFNYTSTLSSVYSIPEQNILYIHNKAIDENSKLILGHAWKSHSKGSFRNETDSDNVDPRAVEGNQIIDQYFKDTFKPSNNIISINKSFFRSLHTIENIYIMGHSMSRVDDEYFREIANSIDLGQVRWKASWFRQEEKETKRQKLIDLGVRNELIEILRLEEFNGDQLQLMELGL